MENETKKEIVKWLEKQQEYVGFFDKDKDLYQVILDGTFNIDELAEIIIKIENGK